MITTLAQYQDSKLLGVSRTIPAVLVKTSADANPVNMLVELNPMRMFEEGFQLSTSDWYGAWPEGDEVIAVPVQDLAHSGNAVGCRIVANEAAMPEGWSNAATCDVFCSTWPDGDGGWLDITDIKPPVLEDEIAKATARLTDIRIQGTYAQKIDALSLALRAIGSDALSEELFDHANKTLKEQL